MRDILCERKRCTFCIWSIGFDENLMPYILPSYRTSSIRAYTDLALTLNSFFVMYESMIVKKSLAFPVEVFFFENNKFSYTFGTFMYRT